mgnify:CR=1 FL=1
MKKWIAAFRLRTLPLAIANTILGSSLAYYYGGFRWSVFVLAAITTILLQIISNMANDYGDFVNGKDTAERIGPKRMVQSGEISPGAMLKAIIFAGILAAISGLWLIIIGTRGIEISYLVVFVVLGLAAIVAAIKYTIGKNPYGYRGLGDIFVFLFFGLVGVCGTFFLHTQQFNPALLLPASALGFLSAGVLNVNNLRDYHADKNAGKRTLVVAIGIKKARVYHVALILAAFVFSAIYILISAPQSWLWLCMLTFALFIRHLKKTSSFTDAKELFPELGKLAIATFLFALTFSIGLILS